MFSPTQHEDKKFLMELVQLIELLVKIKTTESLDLAERFGEHYIKLKEKIKNFDYSKDDKSFYQLQDLCR